jgi:hypothetical protein
MDGLKVESRPSTLNILRKFYTRVTRLDQYIRDKVSENRYAKVLRVANEHNGMSKLIETAYVCVNPKIHLIQDDDDDDGLNDPSVLSIGDHATQSEVFLASRLC